MSGYYGLTREFNRSPSFPGQIGRGLSLNKMVGRAGTLQLNTGLERVDQSIRVILSTRRGSRFFNPSFGSDLHSILFETNVFSKRQEACIYAKQAIETWEPRVSSIEITATPEQELGKVSLLISYRVVGDNGAHEMRYDLVAEGGRDGVGA